MNKVSSAVFSLILLLTAFAATAYGGVKKTVAVAEFENKSSFSGYFQLGTGMADMLTDSLMQSNQFIVLERQSLDAVLAEQNLAASGRASQTGTGAKSGDIKKAQILIQGSVTEFEENTSEGSQGLNLYGVTVNNNSASAHVAIIIRLINTTTSEVIASQRVEGEASEGGLAFSATAGAVDFGQSAFKKTPLGKATQMAIDRAVNFIATRMAGIPWKGSVIKVDEEGFILVNAGANFGIAPGQVLKVSRVGESLVDPDTGMELGVETQSIGTIKVEQVLDKYSKAKPVFLEGDAARGDMLEALG